MKICKYKTFKDDINAPYHLHTPYHIVQTPYSLIFINSNILFNYSFETKKWKKILLKEIILDEKTILIVYECNVIYSISPLQLKILDLTSLNLHKMKIPKFPFLKKFSSIVLDKKIYILGGLDKYNLICRDFYCFDLINLTLKQLNKLFHGIYSHTCSIYGNKIYIFGGLSTKSNKAINDVYAYNIKHNHWMYIHCGGHAIEGRMEHMSCVLNDEMYIFGGYQTFPKRKFLNDLYSLNLKNHIWKKIEYKCIDKPIFGNFNMIGYNNTLFIFHKNEFNGFFKIHLKSKIFKKLTNHFFDTIFNLIA